MPASLTTLLLVPGAIVVAFVLLAIRRNCAAEAAAQALAAERGRSLGQLAREVQFPAFALLGHAAALPPPPLPPRPAGYCNWPMTSPNT